MQFRAVFILPSLRYFIQRFQYRRYLIDHIPIVAGYSWVASSFSHWIFHCITQQIACLSQWQCVLSSLCTDFIPCIPHYPHCYAFLYMYSYTRIIQENVVCCLAINSSETLNWMLQNVINLTTKDLNLFSYICASGYWTKVDMRATGKWSREQNLVA